MLGRKSKLLIYSPNNDFIKDMIDPLWKNFDVQISTTTEMSIFLAREWGPEICLVDVDSQDDSLIASLRQNYHHLQMGIVALSNHSTPHKEEGALRAGADHYLALPCTFNVLSWRLQGIQKRNASHTAGSGGGHAMSDANRVSSITIGNLKIYPNDYLIKKNNEVVNSTPTQFNLLLAFITHRDQLLSRAWLKEFVWENADISPRSIDAQISKLKKLLPDLDPYLSNVYGKGYIFSIPDSHSGSESGAA